MMSYNSVCKVEEGDVVYVYLLLDFLSLLFTTLVKDNPEGSLQVSLAD